MTGHRAVFDLRGSVCDQDQVSDVSPWVLAAMWSTTRAPGSQTGGELLPQRPTGLDEQRPIDGVVRHAHREVVRVVHPQSGTDLLRRPPRVQQRFHLGAEPGPPAEFCGPWPPCLRVGCLVSATTVAVDLAAHGGRRPSKTTRDRPIRGAPHPSRAGTRRRTVRRRHHRDGQGPDRRRSHDRAEGFVHDVCHPRDEMARDGARPTAIELATAVIYAHALLGWICNLVLRVVTFRRPASSSTLERLARSWREILSNVVDRSSA